jgi:exonuclease SbcD
MNINRDERNILVAHQFVTGAVRTESEEITVGDVDNVDASIFFDFDYTALGHIHSAQKCERESVRYCGTPLKYSFSEAGDEKSVTVIELFEKGRVQIKAIPLKPLRDMKIIRGSYNELMNKDFYEGTSYREDYMQVILTDEEDVVDAIGRLRSVYRNIMKLSYDNTRTSSSSVIEDRVDVENKTPLEIFADFYKQQNNQDMSEEQEQFLRGLIEEIWEG